MGRLARASREGLGSEDQGFWDNISEAHGGKADGPFSALVHVPPLGSRVSDLEMYWRTIGELPHADRELVVITIAREAEAKFPWAVHERGARTRGTRPEAIEVVRRKGSVESLTGRERVLVNVARSLSRTAHLQDDLYAEALAELGERQLIEVVALCGHYTMIGFVANAFEVDPPEGVALWE
jgi:4-carboxymuconolactone decarboxylase